jgi:hypothetical protein
LYPAAGFGREGATVDVAVDVGDVVARTVGIVSTGVPPDVMTSAPPMRAAAITATAAIREMRFMGDLHGPIRGSARTWRVVSVA